MPATLRRLVLTTSILAFAACSDGRSVAEWTPGTPPPNLPKPPRAGPIAFVDATAESGIADVGLSYGAAAGDFDGDGQVDLFTTGHFGSGGRLWQNRGHGRFVDVAEQVLQPVPSGDMHGAQWADFDEDGLPELLILSGAGFGAGGAANRMYSRRGSTLVDVAESWGVQLPAMRGRTPLAVDYDQDGRLDLFMTAAVRSDGQIESTLMLQMPGGWFADRSSTFGFELGTHCRFGVLGDLDGDTKVDALFEGYPVKAFALGGTPIREITQDIGLVVPWLMTDAVVADLSGDGRNEIYVARSELASGFHLEDDHTVEFRAIVHGTEHGVTIRPSGVGATTFGWGPGTRFTPSDVFIGADGHHPPHNDFTLSTTDPANRGVVAHVAGQDAGLYIGWDAAMLEWRASFSSPNWNELLIRATSTEPVSQPTALGFDPFDTAKSDSLLAWQDGRYVDRSTASGLPAGQRSRAVVAADFDNDMDLDLYLVTAESTRNTPNVLLENAGDGTFSRVATHGAAGSPLGIGDTVLTLDYNRDGRVDLFLVNGAGSAFRQVGQSNTFADDGPAELLRNTTTNRNHWLDIELVGTNSSRSGIGARIEVTAGGRTQVREHGGGMHRQGQSSGIHFGMGSHIVANQVLVSWPSGTRTVMRDVRVDQTLLIVE